MACRAGGVCAGAMSIWDKHQQSCNLAQARAVRRSNAILQRAVLPGRILEESGSSPVGLGGRWEARVYVTAGAVMCMHACVHADSIPVPPRRRRWRRWASAWRWPSDKRVHACLGNTDAPIQAPMAAVGFRVEVAKWLALVRLLMGEVPEHAEFTAPGLAKPLAAYFGIAQAVRAGDLTAFRSGPVILLPAHVFGFIPARCGREQLRGFAGSWTWTPIVLQVSDLACRCLWPEPCQAAAHAHAAGFLPPLRDSYHGSHLYRRFVGVGAGRWRTGMRRCSRRTRRPT